MRDPARAAARRVHHDDRGIVRALIANERDGFAVRPPPPPASSQVTLPPDIGTLATHSRCPRRDPNMIVVPSGDQAGPFSVATPETRVFDSPPAEAGTTRIM